MKASITERKKIYDLWHKEVYQTNLDQSVDAQNILHESILPHLKINKNSKFKLLDLACGKGLFLKDLKKYNSNLELYGSDISKVAIEEAGKMITAELSVSDAEKLPYKSNFFDRIACLGGVEYFDDPVRGVKESSRILKKNGYAIFFVPNLMFIGYIWLALRYGMMPTHGGESGDKVYYDYNSERFYTRKGWEDVFIGGGFDVVSIHPYNYIGNTRFANPVVLWIYNKFVSRFLPLNFAYAFIFVCKKK